MGEGGTIPNSFHEGGIALILKPDEHSTNKGNYRSTSPMNTEAIEKWNGTK